ncbi:Uncharacterized protein TCM_044247 [Theobroma cacao]|uniref:Uncharacterized protein n=1 Tax=Theobroma cacao TaxID=3641 RepID=A0A061FPM9_THECC|nr:Uncharacterized protein TCM_044247 [Theobroma cacao]
MLKKYLIQPKHPWSCSPFMASKRSLGCHDQIVDILSTKVSCPTCSSEHTWRANPKVLAIPRQDLASWKMAARSSESFETLIVLSLQLLHL